MRGKSHKLYVIKFENNLLNNLLSLQEELKNQTYKPKPLQTFIIRGPKTRKISKSHFRDRVVHHALCNVIEPTLSNGFIFDSYANRKGKGTHKAVQRFDYFKKKVSKNNKKPCYVLKADIKHYFAEVAHKILLDIINRKIKDEKIIWLIKVILENHKTKQKGKGMPLGNLTSQFFANVFLNELDYFVKRKLRVKYYVRYVDDIAVFSNSKKEVEGVVAKIAEFLKNNLNLELHSEKTKIKLIHSGIKMLGYRIYYHYKLPRKSNLRKFKRNFSQKLQLFKEGELSQEGIILSLQGWFGYAMWANTYKLRQRITEEVLIL